VSPQFSSEFPEALLFAIHKQGNADAYAIFLCREPERAKAMIRDALPALSFVP
jgi:hypothetical protein